MRRIAFVATIIVFVFLAGAATRDYVRQEQFDRLEQRVTELEEWKSTVQSRRQSSGNPRAAGGSAHEPGEDAPDQAGFKWKVWNEDGELVEGKTGTKTLRRQGDFKYRGTHRGKYEWHVTDNRLVLDHGYYGNKWVLWPAGERGFVGRYAGKKDAKEGWRCEMVPLSSEDWEAWQSFPKGGASESDEAR